MKNIQKVNNPKINNLTRNDSYIYLENELDFRVENDFAYCKHYGCKYKTDDFFKAEEHWYKIHYVW